MSCLYGYGNIACTENASQQSWKKRKKENRPQQHQHQHRDDLLVLVVLVWSASCLIITDGLKQMFAKMTRNVESRFATDVSYNNQRKKHGRGGVNREKTERRITEDENP